jgi:Tol biopolymer transport system component
LIIFKVFEFNDSMRMGLRKFVLITLLISCYLIPTAVSSIHYLAEWGIYELDPVDGTVSSIFTSPDEIITIRLDPTGEILATSIKTGGIEYEHTELYTVRTDGTGLTRLTDNQDWDLYPSWSPDGDELGFLSFRDETLDIWVMDADGGNQRLLYDSGGHEADIHWVGDLIAFTRDSQIWVMNSDGTNAHRITDPPRAGEWGDAVLPFGDYDPRISPDGSRVVYERLVDDTTQYGNYDLFMVNIDGSSETRLTENGWTQGLVSWSNDGQKLVYIVSAVDLDGKYDLFFIDPDGSGMVDITSDILPREFLANSPIFSKDDSTVYFIGQWYGWKILDSFITCALSASSVDLGNAVTVTGSLGPYVQSVDIQVTFTQPDGPEVIFDVTTDGGNYALDFQPDQLGEWEVMSSWAGDSGHSESSSEVNKVTVLEEAEPENSGIPGFYIETVLVGLSVFYLKKACHPGYKSTQGLLN